MYSFAKKYRLLTANEFSSVFAFRKRLIGQYFNAHYLTQELGYSRLGLVVAKKVAKRANVRNYMKRVFREYFRLNLAQNCSLDLIIRVTKTFNTQNYLTIIDELTRLSNQVLKIKNSS